MNGIVNLPAMTIDIGGAAVGPDVRHSLERLSVRQMISTPAQCEVTFADPPASFIAGDALRLGGPLRVTVGTDEPLFDGELTAVEYGHGPSGVRVLRARGYDKLHRLRKSQPVRARVQMTCADLARELVQPLEITVEAPASGPNWVRMVQFRQSDFDLLRDITERCGLYFTLTGQTLRLIDLAGTGTAVALTFGDTLLEARIEINCDAACRSVKTVGWDPARVEACGGEAGSPRLGRDIGARVLPAAGGGTGDRTLVDEALHNDDQAKAIAQAELDRRAAADVIMRGVAEGDVRLRPGAIVDVRGTAASLEGRYVLTRVHHTLDATRGFVSEFSTEPPEPRPRERGTIAAWGRVSRVDDPEKLGRIQVALPTYEGVETDWMSVLTPGAGVGKGMVFLPDKDDHVLVLFTNHDPSKGVVLGGLYGSGGAPEAGGVKNGAVKQFGLFTPGGHKLVFDDASNTVRLENKAGSYMELAPDRCVLHAECDLTIEAPGKTLTIAADKVDFERR